MQQIFPKNTLDNILKIQYKNEFSNSTSLAKH